MWLHILQAFTQADNDLAIPMAKSPPETSTIEYHSPMVDDTEKAALEGMGGEMGNL